MFNLTASIAFDENDCLLKTGSLVLSKLDIILVIIPALSFAETLGAILLALNVFEKTINLESCASVSYTHLTLPTKA